MTTNDVRTPLFSRGASTEHAIVVGGSIAGMLAARVLSDYFTRVTVLDRDAFPEAPEHRKGIPQSHHAHGLLERGHRIIEQLFPGIIEQMQADGATVSAPGSVPLVLVSPKGKLRPLPAEEGSVAFSRYFMEWHIRRRLGQRGNLRIVSNCEVEQLLATAGGDRIIGVQARRRGSGQPPERLEADLVVDASGRHSRVPQWLTALGYDAPEEETINSNIGYASRFYAKPARFPASWSSIIINGRPPDNPRAGLILAIEHDRWHVTMGGFAGHYPPTDEAGFLQWAKELPDPSIYEAIRIAQPLTPIRGFRTPRNRLRHFDRLERWPERLVATGDSVCAFNPIYGQGMTTSALDALALEQSLREQQQRPRAGFEQRFQRRVAQTVAAPWLIATGEDLRWEGIALEGARPRWGLRWIHRYMDLVLEQARGDQIVSQAYSDVLNMMQTPESLMRPRVAGRVLMGVIVRGLGVAAPASDDQGPLALSPQALAVLREREAARV
ncbi:MAG: FAD-dependent monooxygenase [Myxococcota bacterium]